VQYHVKANHFPDQTLTAEDDDAAADTYEYDSDADAAAFGGDADAAAFGGDKH